MNSVGTVTGGTCVDSDNASEAVTGGALNLTSSCIVTGTVNTQSGTSTVTHASMDRGKTVIVGVGKTSGTLGLFQFSAAKR